MRYVFVTVNFITTAVIIGFCFGVLSFVQLVNYNIDSNDEETEPGDLLL